MKVMVIYDSMFGNTAQVAQAIADGLNGASPDEGTVDLRKIGDARPDELSSLDLLIVGSPTQRFNTTTGMRDFLKKIPRKALCGTIVAGFDTRLTEEELHSHGALLGKLVDWFGYAAPRISEGLENKGGHAVVPPEGFYVGGTEGPLLEGELPRAARWAQHVIARMQNPPETGHPRP